MKSFSRLAGLAGSLLGLAALGTAAGAQEPSSSLADQVPPSAYVTLQNSNVVEQLRTGRLFHGIDSAHYAAIGPDGDTLLVSSIRTGKNYQIDTETGRKTIYPIADVAQGVKISPTGQYGIAIAPQLGEAVVIDLKRKRIVKRIHVGKTPHNARFTTSGRLAYVTLQGQGAVAVIDMQKMALVRTIPLKGMAQPHNLDLADHGSRLWVRDFSGHAAVYALPSGKRLAHFDIGPSHGGIDVVPGGKYVATPAIGGDTVTIINQKSLKKVATIRVGRAPHGVRASANGQWLYVTLTGGDKVAVVDMKTLKKVGDIETKGKFPFWITVKGNP